MMDNFFDILDKNISRSNKLGDWECPDPFFNFEYWEIRSYVQDAMMEGIDGLIRFIKKKYNLKKDYSQNDKISFYFWMKDQLQKISTFEKQILTPQVMQKSNYKPSPRANEFGKLLELKKLSNGDPEKAMRIKKLPYGEVLDMLVAFVVESEGRYENK